MSTTMVKVKIRNFVKKERKDWMDALSREVGGYFKPAKISLKCVDSELTTYLFVPSLECSLGIQMK